ncbi:hypothetical protein Q5530_28235 [Saccharothrix sp. BKS2]|uniref:hypothetical protein n=1 Tax=Saccharothrix sp. BKS2 TaxID=3064400 RepID=UPI0039EB87A9
MPGVVVSVNARAGIVDATTATAVTTGSAQRHNGVERGRRRVLMGIPLPTDRRVPPTGRPRVCAGGVPASMPGGRGGGARDGL